jgi:hypothetical protein
VTTKIKIKRKVAKLLEISLRYGFEESNEVGRASKFGNRVQDAHVLLGLGRRFDICSLALNYMQIDVCSACPA